MTDLKKLPKFRSEKAEREFWATHDATDLIAFDHAERASFPRLKPSTKTISVRLPEPLLDKLKTLANKRDVPYQSLLKVLLAEKIDEAMHGTKF